MVNLQRWIFYRGESNVIKSILPEVQFINEHEIVIDLVTSGRFC